MQTLRKATVTSWSTFSTKSWIFTLEICPLFLRLWSECGCFADRCFYSNWITSRWMDISAADAVKPWILWLKCQPRKAANATYLWEFLSSIVLNWNTSLPLRLYKCYLWTMKEKRLIIIFVSGRFFSDFAEAGWTTCQVYRQWKGSSVRKWAVQLELVF